jgi:hypothetical protein
VVKPLKTAALLAAATLVVAAGCGSDEDNSEGGGDGEVSTGTPDGFEASTGYLSEVVDSSQHQPYRFEMRTSAAGKTAEGSSDGERSDVVIDFGKLMAPALGVDEDELSDKLGVDDLSFEIVSEPSSVYMRAPLYDALGEQLPPGTDLGPTQDLIEAFDGIGDGWAVIDQKQLTAEVPDTAAAQSIGAMDPSSYFKLLGVSEDVDELGLEKIDGVSVTGLKAEVTLGDIYAAQGIDVDKMFPGGAHGIDEALVPIEVWVDKDNHIRRVELTTGGKAMKDALEDAGEDPDDFGPLVDNELEQTIDITDYGDTSIEVEVPTDDLTDITADFIDVMKQVAT